MTREDLLGLWPSNYILGARNWIKNSVIQGDLSNFDIALRANAEALAQPTLPNEALVMTFDLVNTDIRYIRTMTPVTGAMGRGKLEGNRATAVLDSGRVGNISLSNGTVEIPRIYPYGGTLNIAADGEGPVQDLLSLIDEKPFEYVSQYDVEPDSFTGHGKIRLSLSRPLRERISYNDIDYTVTGTLSDVTAPFALGDYSLNNGNVTMLVDRDSLSVKGPVRLGAWDADLAWNETFDAGATPTRYRINGVLGRDDLDGFGLGFREFIDGDIGLKIDAVADGLDITGATVTADLSKTDLRLGPYWSKDAGVSAQMTGDMSFTKVAGLGLNNIQIQAPGLDVAGSLDLATDFRLINLDLSRAKIAGFIDATVQMKPSEEQDRFNALITGNYLDVSPFVAGMVGGDEGQTLDVPILLTAALGRLALNEAYVLRDANVLFAHDGIGVRQARLKGVGDNGNVMLDLQTDDENLQRVLKLDIPSASDAAFAFLGLESVTGGILELEATMPITAIEGPIIGTVSIADMQLVGAPIMTRILSLASLQGLADAMSGEGLRFESAEIPFSLDGYNLSVRGARASGPALGMTGEGEIDFSAKTLDVNGVLVPAYTANSLLADIPLIGDIFVGKKGEGIFALSYTVRGPFEKSQVAVNPLSALTPGFLRGIFAPQREKLPEQVIEKIESVRPAASE
ncbi:AsmA-like C-terminal domain-containing protein [Fretibacter rubidus]